MTRILRARDYCVIDGILDLSFLGHNVPIQAGTFALQNQNKYGLEDLP